VPKDFTLKSDRGPSYVSNNPRDFAAGALRGVSNKFADELMAAGLGDDVYGGGGQELAQGLLGAERDAYIAEQDGVPWYEQALDMAQGLVRAPGAMVEGITGDHPEEFGESMGSAMVPDAYAYASKTGEMIGANPFGAAAEMAAILPQGRAAKMGLTPAKLAYKKADRLRRVEGRLSESLGDIHGFNHDRGGSSGGYVSLHPDANPPIPAMADAWKLGYKLDNNPVFNYSPSDLAEIREYAAHELRSPENLGKLSESIQSSGIREPLIVGLGRDGRSTLIEGNHRHQVAMDAGLESVPVRFNHQQSVPRTSAERASAPPPPAAETVGPSLVERRESLAPRGRATEAEIDNLMDLLTGWGRR
jgi:hypothetical protein